jgi:hypothetical protein
MPDLTRKYFQVGGPAEIRIKPDGNLELYFYEDNGKPIGSTKAINEDEPFVFRINPDKPYVRFVSATMLLELNEQGYLEHKTALGKLAPGITFENAGTPTPATMDAMNPIKPPEN